MGAVHNFPAIVNEFYQTVIGLRCEKEIRNKSSPNCKTGGDDLSLTHLKENVFHSKVLC
jgi:hypothetical protein